MTRDYAKFPKHGATGRRGPGDDGTRLPEDRGQSAAGGGTRRKTRLILLLLAVLITALFGRYWWRELRWRYIVVHHTAAPIGNAAYLRHIHVDEKGWSEMAYHFVINNGSLNTTLGEIEEGVLWKERKPNLSTRIWYMNYFGIAVVMIGNFERHPVPARQKEALVGLLTNLAREYGIPPERIVGHRELQNTACPGKNLNMAEVRRLVGQNLTR